MTTDHAAIAFLKWCLPRLELRWSGYRKVRRLVAKRLHRRLAELGLADLSAYRVLLDRDPGEWERLAAICRIPISRFYRDRAVFEALGRQLLPEAAAKAEAESRRAVRCWSAGCASGEEPYTLAMLWQFCVAPEWPAMDLAVVATDAEEMMIERARIACYPQSSLKELPERWRERAFVAADALFCLRPEFRRCVHFVLQDIRASMPDGPFDAILCRNIVFTYFDEASQHRMLDRLTERLVPGGVLVLGAHERLPAKDAGLTRLSRGLPIYRKEPGSAIPVRTDCGSMGNSTGCSGVGSGR